MTQIRHIDYEYWNSNDKDKRLSAYANAPVIQAQKIYEGFERDSLEFLEMAIWNPVIISNTQFHKPMFDCIIAYTAQANREFNAESSNATARNIEDISRIDIHYHELIEETFGCHVTDISEHNTDPQWIYNHRVKYTQNDIDKALKEQEDRINHRDRAEQNSINARSPSLRVMYFIIGFALSWLIFS